MSAPVSGSSKPISSLGDGVMESKSLLSKLFTLLGGFRPMPGGLNLRTRETGFWRLGTGFPRKNSEKKISVFRVER